MDSIKYIPELLIVAFFNVPFACCLLPVFVGLMMSQSVVSDQHGKPKTQVLQESWIA